MTITITTIRHDHQRYETTGDWWITDNGDLEIRVSDMGDWRYEALIGIHEAIEAVLCKAAGIRGERVDAFDKEFEAARESGRGLPFKFRGRTIAADAEPGDDREAPYRKQHGIATGVERIVAEEMGVDWSAYERANHDLYS